MSPYDIIIAPWITEKSMDAREPEHQNRLEFIVRRTASKTDIIAAVEELFMVKVAKVNTRITKHGKHASVKLAPGHDAEDVALKLGAF